MAGRSFLIDEKLRLVTWLASPGRPAYSHSYYCSGEIQPTHRRVPFSLARATAKEGGDLIRRLEVSGTLTTAAQQDLLKSSVFKYEKTSILELLFFFFFFFPSLGRLEGGVVELPVGLAVMCDTYV